MKWKTHRLGEVEIHDTLKNDLGPVYRRAYVELVASVLQQITTCESKFRLRERRVDVLVAGREKDKTMKEIQKERNKETNKQGCDTYRGRNSLPVEDSRVVGRRNIDYRECML